MDTGFWRVDPPNPAAHLAAEQSTASSQRAERAAADIDERLSKLTLIAWAMWTLIQETTDLTEEDLMQRVKDLDLLDGQSDGKVTRQVARCSQCDRVMSPKHLRCLYCGAEKLIMSAFDTIT